MPDMEIFFDIGGMLFFLIVLTLLVKPVGTYITNVYQGKRTLLSPVLVPLENLIYKAAGIKHDEEMDWKDYAKAMLLFNCLGIIVLFLILLLQGILPLNPQGFPGFSLDLALNTAVSFVTNTNWQAYSGESEASYLTQMSGLAVQNFLSAATGLCVALALIRGFTRHTSQTIGNFWQDMTKSVLYILLPVAIIASLLLVSQGAIQNFDPYANISLVQSFLTPDGQSISNQMLPMGPVASQEAIKEFGTNGGGFFNANSAHPFENPTPLTNFLEILLLLLIPFSLTYTFGRFAGNTRQGWAIFAAMMLLFIVFLGVMYWSEYSGNPLVQPGVNGSYMEGKEVRFGIGGTVLFAVSTTATSTGAVNAMHDSLTPIGGMVTMLLILLSEVVPGGVGSGLYTILAFAIIAVFIAGLMIGRTPEYLGKKIEVFEMWTSVLIVLTSGILVLIFVSIALVISAGISSILNPGPHGLSEVLYAFASVSNNNGSAFAGLNANTLFYNLSTAIAMLIGRFVPAIAALAMAGSLSKKKYIPPSIGTLPTHQITFVLWLAVVILIVGALTFFPALSLGPIVEHMIMHAGQ
ncbi:MAG: potassium-transporting ATPase subunit KdpA [Candidatus Methanoperedens sp.]|nr:potassium-transporting ATPase subunit KdpA [Candidatus Methanoperedens sp.]MCZ7370961.1 potassium-transporting ATPase subunit KdpA [Candidatus Methanoperedens sp.]